jgi:hypothetical protein
MTKPMLAEINCETGVVTERELTAEEIQAGLEAAEETRIAKEAHETELACIEGIKTSARAKLIAGEPLTEEEAATIVL